MHSCSKETRLIFSIDGFNIRQCEICGLRFAKSTFQKEEHLKKTYSSDYFTGGKDGYSDYWAEENLLVKHGERYAEILKSFQNPGTMLDVGAAAGFIMKGFKNKGWTVRGIEPCKEIVQEGNDKFGFSIEHGSFEDIMPKEKFDLVVLIQVIGHFFDLHKALDQINNVLKPDGLVLIESWDYQSFFAKNMGKSWHEYSPPSVLNWLSQPTLDILMEERGFVKKAKGKPIKKIDIKHALSLAGYKYKVLRPISKLTNGILGKKSFTVNYPPLDIFWAIYQKTI